MVSGFDPNPALLEQRIVFQADIVERFFEQVPQNKTLPPEF